MIYKEGQEVILRRTNEIDKIKSISYESGIYIWLEKNGRVTDSEIVPVGCNNCRFLGRPTYFDPCSECVINKFKYYESKE